MLTEKVPQDAGRSKLAYEAICSGAKAEIKTEPKTEPKMEMKPPKLAQLRATPCVFCPDTCRIAWVAPSAGVSPEERFFLRAQAAEMVVVHCRTASETGTYLPFRCLTCPDDATFPSKAILEAHATVVHQGLVHEYAYSETRDVYKEALSQVLALVNQKTYAESPAQRGTDLVALFAAENRRLETQLAQHT